LGLKVLSLFDGMSCGRLALDRLGIKVDKYYASEIDKYAIQVAQANYPDTIHIGDVCDIKAEDYQDIDLILAGSPCQGFSFAGKQLAFDDPRSALFFEFVRLLKEIKPKYFLLENVKMKKEFLDVISEQVSACYPDFEGGDMFGGKIEPILINSALVSAQNRQRYYWTNISGVEQPEQRGIVLRDILENGFDSERDKSYCLDANYYKGSSVENYFKKSRRQMVYQDETHDTPKRVGDLKNGSQGDRIYSKDGKAITLNAQSGGTAGSGNMLVETHDTPKKIAEIDMPGHDILKRVYSVDGKSPTVTAHAGKGTVPKIETHDTPKQVGTAEDINGHDILKRVYSPDGKAPTLNTMGGGNREPKVVGGAWRGRYEDDKSIKQNLELRKDGKTNSLTTVQKDNVVVENETYWRKLTCVECERLQTVPDNYTNHVSNTQRYKMLGNGWTIEVIAHILKNIK
jgi:DNA (cytosine-5)-methyltransferase 3A